MYIHVVRSAADGEEFKCVHIYTYERLGHCATRKSVYTHTHIPGTQYIPVPW